jgi:hypothetical protein
VKLTEEKVIELVDKWRLRLNISPQWSIGIHLIDEKKKSKKSLRDAYASTTVSEEYFQADITFNGWMFEEKDDEFLDLVACHEVLHIIFNKQEVLVTKALGEGNEELADILNENIAEIISRALVKKD